MSVLPQQPSEDQDIYVAIPPPLVPPLVRQLGSSHESSTGTTHLPTPISTRNSSVSQSYAQWTLDNQYQRSMGTGFQGSNNGQGNTSIPSGPGTRTDSELASSETLARLPPPSGESTSNGRSSNTPASPVLSSQLMNRLYSLSAAMGPPSSDTPCTAPQQGVTSRSGAGTGFGITSASFFSANPIFGSSSNNGVNNGNNVGGSSSNARSPLQYPSLGHSPELHRGGSTSSMTESTRAAAATAIVNTLNRGETRPSRGESPYIPSSLSMLFSDPEVMQLQEEVERAQMHQHQLRMRQRYLDSRRSFSGDAGLSNERQGPTETGIEDDGGLINDIIDEDDEEDGDIIISHNNNNNTDVNREDGRLRGSDQMDMRYGYELVQDEQQDDEYHPYATVMSRSDYLAPHEPSSSSPLFPSPLTTLGSFTPLSDQLEEQHAEAGRIWQSYGTMAHGQTDMATPLNQSHAAYYHAVSNYHYSSQDDEGSRIGGGGVTESSPLMPTPCIPGAAQQWRRHRGRDNSYQSYTSIESLSGNNNNHRNCWSCFRCRQDGPPEDSWLRGALASIVGGWICCRGCC